MKKFYLMILTFLFAFSFFACSKADDALIYLSPGDTLDQVRSKIYLVSEIDDEVIIWTSSNEQVISTTGIVNRPLVGEMSVEVELKATLAKKTYTYKLKVQPLTGNKILDLYPGLNDMNHIITEITYENLIDLLTQKEEALIYLGFENCPWCKEYLPIFHQMAKNTGHTQIYYYNFLEIRKIIDGALHEDFQRIINLIDTDLLVKNPTNDELWWLYAPTFIGLKDGEVKGLFTGAIPEHVASRKQLTVQQLKDLKTHFEEILYGVIPFDPDCVC